MAMIDVVDRYLGSDPGGERVRTATNGAIAVLAALGASDDKVVELLHWFDGFEGGHPFTQVPFFDGVVGLQETGILGSSSASAVVAARLGLPYTFAAFRGAKAEWLWWHQYVPLLHVVSVTGLPMTAAADKLAHEDLSDVGILELAGVLAPVVLFAADRDPIRHDVAVRDWGALRAALGRIGAAEHGIRGSTTALEFSGRGLIGTARLGHA